MTDIIRDMLSTGRKVNSFTGVIGVDLDEHELAKLQQYDEVLFTSEWTKEERIELAEKIIERWRSYIKFITGRDETHK